MAAAGILDVIVVGAGHAGLAVSQRLTAAGLDHVVLERGEVGETWRAQRWDSFALNTPNEMNGLPGSPYAGPDPHGFALTAEWVSTLDRYARACGLPVRTRTAVLAVEHDGPGAFRVSTSAGDVLRTRSVVVASGVATVPKIPEGARDLDPGIHVLTTGTYRRPDALPPGAVLVVGGAQSAVQIAEDLVEAGRTVFLASSRVGRAPRRARGRDTLLWLLEIGWFHHRPQDLADPAMMRWPNPQVSGVGPRGHSVSYQSLAAREVTLLGRFEGASGTRARFADDLAANVRFADERAAVIRTTIDDHIAKRGIDAPPTEPDPADAPAADASRYTAPAELDLRERGIGTVVFATGFRGDFSYLRLPVVDAAGTPVQAEGRSPVDGLWFVGIPWMRFRGSGVIRVSQDDSAHIAGQVVSRLREGASGQHLERPLTPPGPLT